MEFLVKTVPKEARTRCELCTLSRIKVGLPPLESLNGEFTVTPMDNSLTTRTVCHIDLPELIAAMVKMAGETQAQPQENTP